MELDKITEMIQPKVAVPDNTKQEVWQVFGDKSVEGDQLKQISRDTLNNMGLSDEDILGIVMASVGGGGGGIMKALKGMGGKGGLKGLVGKIGSKAKFPQGYGAPQSPGAPPQIPAFARKALNKRMNPMERMQNEKESRTIIQEAINQLMNPNTVIKEEGIKKGLKGMRKVGIRG